MAIRGLDLLISRRRAHVTAQSVAAQMGVTRQYVSKLEAREDVTPEAAEMYRSALAALEGDRASVTVEVSAYPADYRTAGRQFRARIRNDDAAKTLYTVIVQPSDNWQAVLAILDSLAQRGSRSKVVIASDDGEPVVMPRIG